MRQNYYILLQSAGPSGELHRGLRRSDLERDLQLDQAEDVDETVFEDSNATDRAVAPGQRRGQMPARDFSTGPERASLRVPLVGLHFSSERRAGGRRLPGVGQMATPSLVVRERDCRGSSCEWLSR